MDWIGRERFSGATSDSTGNTHLCKKLLVEDVKTVIPNPDICHYISNLIKDVARIDFFETVSLDRPYRSIDPLINRSRLSKLCEEPLLSSIHRIWAFMSLNSHALICILAEACRLSGRHDLELSYILRSLFSVARRPSRKLSSEEKQISQCVRRSIK